MVPMTCLSSSSTVKVCKRNSYLQASTNIPEPSADVEVFLVNGKSVKVRVGTYDRTDQVLEKVCAEIKLGSEFTYYFGLFLEKEEEDSTWTGCHNNKPHPPLNFFFFFQ